MHIAREKIMVAINKSQTPQSLGNSEYVVLRDLSAFENLMERFNACSTEREDADDLANRIAAGPITQAHAPSPMFAKLTQRLATTGIRIDFAEEKLTFRFERPQERVLPLAQSIAHPWLTHRTISAIGVDEDIDEFHLLAEVNARAKWMLVNGVPESLKRQVLNQLHIRLREYIDALVNHKHLQFHTSSLFSGRAVIQPEIERKADQVGIPQEMAWTLFGPQVTREMGNAQGVRMRSEPAMKVLDQIMSHSWVILYRAPAMMLTSFIAFRPVRHADNAIHLDPIVCPMLNADFDGDMAAVFLPVTEEAQREAGEKLSIAGHLARDPGLLSALLPKIDSMWGLAHLSLMPEGQREINSLAGIEVDAPHGFITSHTLLYAMRQVLKQSSIGTTIERLENLMQRGFEAAKASGASMSPFPASDLQQPLLVDPSDLAGLDTYAEQITEQLYARKDFDSVLGPQLLSVQSGARRRVEPLKQYFVRWNDTLSARAAEQASVGKKQVFIPHGYQDGLTPDEIHETVQFALGDLVSVGQQFAQWHQDTGDIGQGGGVISRAWANKTSGRCFCPRHTKERSRSARRCG